jgi:hypothetical protein
VLLALQVLLDSKDSKEHRVLLVDKEFKEPLVLLVLLALLVHRVSKDSKERKVLLVDKELKEE